MKDRYQEQTVRQNSGLPCSDCGAHSGHFNACPLINRASAEALSATKFDLADLDFLRLFRIAGDDPRE